jgi:hypothetical protein
MTGIQSRLQQWNVTCTTVAPARKEQTMPSQIKRMRPQPNGEGILRSLHGRGAGVT